MRCDEIVAQWLLPNGRETVLHWVARSGNATIVANLIDFGSPVAPKATNFYDSVKSVSHDGYFAVGG